MSSPLALVINCGSSSVKFAVIDLHSQQIHLSGLAERLGSPEALIRFEQGQERQSHTAPSANYQTAFALLLERLEQLGLCSAIRVVGHRVVHGGEHFSAPTLLTPEVMQIIEACVPLAPLHNPANIAGIQAAQQAFAQLPHVGVFDTAFHQHMPAVAYRYAVPQEWYTQHGVRRYGFHGTSHAYVAQQAAKLLERPLQELHLITAHLGNGCSACAIAGGRSIDTTMGLTPLEGLVMGTRSGDLDAGILHYLSTQTGQTLDQLTEALNKHSGLLGLSGGLSNDMRTLEQAALAGHAEAQLAIEVFVYRLAKYIGALAVALGQLDALIFTGGIGENSPLIRAKTLQRLQFLGLSLDQDANEAHGQHTNGRISQGCISQSAQPSSSSVATAPPAALVVRTNEEWMIAAQSWEVVQGLAGGQAQAQE